MNQAMHFLLGCIVTDMVSELFFDKHLYSKETLESLERFFIPRWIAQIIFYMIVAFFCMYFTL